MTPGTVIDLVPADRAYLGTLSAERELYQLDDGVHRGLDGPLVATGRVLRGQLDGNRVVATQPYNTQVATPPTYCQYDVTTGERVTTFGANGCAEAPRAYFSTSGIARTPDGYRAVVQRDCSNGCLPEEESFGLVRFDPDGAVDATFGTGGILYATFLPELSALAFAPQSTGDLVITGYTGLYNMKLFRIHPDGSLDPAFGTDGLVPGANGGRLQVLADDTILVESTYNGTERIDRYTADGRPLPGFGIAGQADLEALTASGFDNELGQIAAAVDELGRILVAYRRRDADGAPYRYFVLRLAVDGALDTTFGAGGIVSDFGEPLSDLTGIGTDAAGRIVFGARVAGYVRIGHLAP